MHRHHIIPKHQGGSDEESNIELLTESEHALAHKKLYEQFGKWEDWLAWQGLAGLLDKQEIVKLSQVNGAKKSLELYGNPWTGRQSVANFAVNSTNQQKAVEAARSETSIQKRKATMAKNGHQQGAKNTMYMTAMYRNEHGELKRFKRDQQPEGWRLSTAVADEKKDKTNNAYGRSWYHDDSKKNYFLKRDDSLITSLNLSKGRITA